MKNSKYIAPHVSLSPEVGKRIESYLKIRPKSHSPYLFVSTGKSAKGIKSSTVSTVVNTQFYLPWRKVMVKKLPKLPQTFQFNSQRHNLQTETRHNPQAGQPKEEVINDFLGHGKHTAREVYKNKLSAANHMGAAVWAHSLLTGHPTDFKPIALEFEDHTDESDDSHHSCRSDDSLSS